MHWDGTVTLGQVLTIAGVIAGLVSHFYALRSRIDWITRIVTEHDKALERHGARIDAHQEDIAHCMAGLGRRRRGDGGE